MSGEQLPAALPSKRKLNVNDESTTWRPRVAHLVPAEFGADGVYGGAERYVAELARHMAEQTPTTLVTYGAVDRDSWQGKLRVSIIGNPRFVRGQQSNPFSPRLLSRIRDADVIHCHQQHIVTSTVACVFGRLTRKKVFVTDLGGGGWDLSGYVSTDRWYHGHLHLSEYSRRVFGHATWPRASVIYGGVDTEKFSPDPSIDPEPLVVFVGRILPHKGVDDLIRGLPEGVSLVVIGRALDNVYLQRLHELAAGKPIAFRHDALDRDVVDAYRRAMCVVAPSVYRASTGAVSRVPELLGQTLLEAMACGAATICTDVASLPEIVEHEVTGFVVPPNEPTALRDRLEQLRDQPQLARQFGRAGRERVMDKFQWEAVVKQCLKIYSRS